jgi:hypothetical protein
MTSTTPNYACLVARLQQQEAAVRVARNGLNDNTARALAAFHNTEQQLGLCISSLTSTPPELDAEQARLTKLEEQRTIVLAKQAEFEKALVDAPDWRLAGDARARDKEYDRQQALKMQLRRLREGTLLFAPNEAYGRIEDLDVKIEGSKQRIEGLREQLAAHLQHAETLLAEVVTG